MNRLKRVWKYYHQYGLKLILLKIFKQYPIKSIDYMQWMDKYGANEDELIVQTKKTYENNVKISIAVPAYHTSERFLREMIESVQKQSYSNWELCVADGSEDEHTYQIVEEYANKDRRIKVKKLPVNKGISGNTNEAFSMCSGKYIGLLDHDDVLALNALYEIRCAIDRECEPDVIYTDEDKMSMDGTSYFEPHFKSNYNRELLRANNYICHFFVIKDSVLLNVKGMRKEFDGAQDYDFILRCTECARSVVHIAKPLYHWRSHRLSTAGNPESKMYAYEAGKKAISAHLKRQDEKGQVEFTDNLGFYHVKYELQSKDRVTIIIVRSVDCPSEIRLKRCVRSIKQTIGYENYHILVVDCFSDINLDNVEGKYILLVNSAISVISRGWMNEMLGNCQRSQVGAVGIKLYNKNETIRHGGIVLGMRGYAFEGWPRVKHGYFHRESLMQNMSAVTVDFMMISKSVFSCLKGNSFELLKDEREFCKKIRDFGKDIIYNPEVEAYIFGKSSRGKIVKECDKYYNDNRSVESGKYFFH